MIQDTTAFEGFCHPMHTSLCGSRDLPNLRAGPMQAVADGLKGGASGGQSIKERIVPFVGQAGEDTVAKNLYLDLSCLLVRESYHEPEICSSWTRSDHTQT